MRTQLPLLLLCSALIGGCAATIPAELANARRAYSDAYASQASTLVPAEVHKAREALAEAEAEFKKDPKGYHTRDLAYVAQRKAELAEALAARAAEETATAAANVQYQATQDAIMRDTRARLGQTQTDLAASQASEAQTSTQLAASESARATAERARVEADARTAAAMSALAKLAAVKEEARGLVITLSGSVLFRTDEATLLPEAQTRLGQVADALLATKERSIVVEGHTDSMGSDEHNQELSQRRAETVRTFLTSRGYDAARIGAVGIGEARPIADNATPEGRANNRRVEIVIAPVATASR